MPTGYTNKIYSGKPQTFGEFAISCARAFGALVEMRDDNPDAPIPFEIKPDEYHRKALEEAQKKLGALCVVSAEDAATEAEREFQRVETQWKKSRAERLSLSDRYVAMLDQVNAWSPPTEDHKALKEFMVQQITESIRFDCSTSWPYPVQQSGSEWLKAERARATRDVDYHREEWDKACRRAAERTAWLRALRASL
jgi:hypothetical protein